MNSTTSMFSMQGRRALITGATGHLGVVITLALAKAGAHVLVNGRSAARVASLVEVVRQKGGNAEGLVFDVTAPEDVRRQLKPHLDKPLHVLINNAYHGGAGTLEKADPQAYRDSYEVTLVAAHDLLRVSLPALRSAVAKDGDAAVINIATMYGLVSPDARMYDTPGVVNPPFYGAAKAALIQWTRYAACELGMEGIRVNSISPGPFPAQAVQNDDPAFIARLSEKVPLGRIGMAAELAGPILFLASSASSYVNGANLAVDGGWTAW